MPSQQFITYQINQNNVTLNDVNTKADSLVLGQTAIGSNVDSVKDQITNDLPTRASQTSVNTIDGVVDTILAKVDTEVQAILDRANLLSTQATQDAIKTVVDNIYSKVDTEVQAILTKVNSLSTQTTQNVIDNNIDTLVTRLTAIRAGYFDNLVGLAGGSIIKKIQRGVYDAPSVAGTTQIIIPVAVVPSKSVVISSSGMSVSGNSFTLELASSTKIDVTKFGTGVYSIDWQVIEFN